MSEELKFKVGDKVRISDRDTEGVDKPSGWDSLKMDDTKGRVYKISKVDKYDDDLPYGIDIGIGVFWYTPDMVEYPYKFNVGDRVRIKSVPKERQEDYPFGWSREMNKHFLSEGEVLKEAFHDGRGYVVKINDVTTYTCTYIYLGEDLELVSTSVDTSSSEMEDKDWSVWLDEVPPYALGEDSDPVDNPSHYTQGSIECIDVIEEALGDKFPGYLRGNILKYLWRYEDKNGVEDLKKARWYLSKLIDYEYCIEEVIDDCFDDAIAYYEAKWGESPADFD